MTTAEWLRQDWFDDTPPFSRLTLAIFRMGQMRRLRPLWLVLDLIWTKLLMGAELPRSVTAGPRLHLPHGGRGVILHHATQLGSDVTIYHHATIGRSDHKPEAAPKIGDRVYIGAGAVVVGGITVGDDSRIGANAAVVTDVPAGATAVGVPAVIRG